MEVLVYVLIAAVVGLGVLLALVYSIQKDNIERLNSRIGELNSRIEVLTGVKEEVLEKVGNLSLELEGLDTKVYHLDDYRRMFTEGFKVVSDMSYKIYEEEINLVANTDFTNVKNISTGFCPNGMGLRLDITSSSRYQCKILGEDWVEDVTKFRKLSDILDRAKELKELQSKLCCKKKTKKTTKKVSKKKGK